MGDALGRKNRIDSGQREDERTYLEKNIFIIQEDRITGEAEEAYEISDYICIGAS